MFDLHSPNVLHNEFQQKVNDGFRGIFRNWEAMSVLFLRGRRADFKARAKLVLRLRTANLL